MKFRSKRARRCQGYLQGAGAKIWYRAIGQGSPLVLLHGGPGADHTDFLPFLRPLARHFRLVLFDQRGSGRSERLANPRGYRLEYMVEDLEALRKHLRIRSWVVLGHSFGGILAQAYAIKHPRHIAGLVLAGTASSARSVESDFRRIRAKAPALARVRLTAMERTGIFTKEGRYKPAYAALSMQILGRYMYVKPPPPTYKPPPIATDIVREMWSGRSDYRIHGNLKGFDFTRQLHKVSAPVLIIVGDHDMVSPASAELTRRSCRRATLVVMGASSHMMFVDQTEQFRELLTLFVRHCASETGRRGRG